MGRWSSVVEWDGRVGQWSGVLVDQLYSECVCRWPSAPSGDSKMLRPGRPAILIGSLHFTKEEDHFQSNPHSTWVTAWFSGYFTVFI